jgi:hypothetical protein
MNIKLVVELLLLWLVAYLISPSKPSSQSLQVKWAAYACDWNDRSQKFKKLLHILIARAQEPVTFTAGKFYVVSLETFANVRIVHF